MARIGLNNFRYGILTEAEDGTPSYDGAKKLRKAISCNVEVENNDASLYADDVLVESDKSFSKATVTIGIDDDDMEVLADILGHTYTEEDGLIRKSDDVAPYVGFGRIVTKIVDGKPKYKVEMIYKCKFGIPSQEETTKGDGVEFGTTELEGTASALADGKWSVAKVFETKAEAVTYLESLFTTGA